MTGAGAHTGFFTETSRYLPPHYRVREACEPWEIDGSARLRHTVFCVEQKIFDQTDRDDIDRFATTLAATSTLAGMEDEVVGTVRIHEAAPRHWTGSRLAVAKGHRRVGGIGTHLIRLAVCLAHARGAARFDALVQNPNVALFESLHWHTIGTRMLHGHPHHHMQADLAYYPAADAHELQVLVPMRDAA
jgi:putative N-acetyltransferase (TIGR04045 family)